MRILGQILRLISFEMKTPSVFGGFHICFIIFIALITLLLCRKLPPSEKNVRKMLMMSSLIILFLEVYKQIVFSFEYVGEKIIFNYPWYIFPFQFCSTPLYIGFIAAFAKRKILFQSLCAFTATYAFLAGVGVVLYPAGSLCSILGINIQTMLWHGSMVATGGYLLLSGFIRANKDTFFKAFFVFLAAVVLAVALNELAYRVGLTKTHEFNMFFFSPYCEPRLPVFSMVQAVLPPFICIAVYVVGFSVGVLFLLLAVGFIKKTLNRQKSLDKSRTGIYNR